MMIGEARCLCQVSDGSSRRKQLRVQGRHCGRDYLSQELDRLGLLTRDVGLASVLLIECKLYFAGFAKDNLPAPMISALLAVILTLNREYAAGDDVEV